MKRGVFITSPLLGKVVHAYPWQKAGAILSGRETELPSEKGLLTFRRFFRAEKAVKRAVLRATALGIFDVCINGERVGAEELKPGWTDYRVRVFEFEYDVTALIREENVLTAAVSNGWWSGRISYGFYGYKSPAFCAEIELEYEDGESEIIASDESFDSCVQGPVTFADIWDGEYFDATKKFDIDHKGFQSSVRFDGFTGQIVPHVGEPVRVRKHLERAPVSATVYSGTEGDGSDYGKIRVISSGETDIFPCRISGTESVILDMGKNMVGRPRICLSATRGTKITVYFAEMLNDSGSAARGCDGPEGSLYIKNYRSALSRAVYVAAGEGEEEYAPRFTFFGFRYIEIKADGEAELLSVAGEVLGTDMRETGRISTDNAEVNKLIENIIWGARGNYVSVPTDCPQRDERLGWTGDTQIFCGAGAYLMDVSGFMRKWLCDMRDSQVGYADGYCSVVPRIWHHRSCAHSAWTDASIIVAYRMYKMYGDAEHVREHYDSMERYMAAIARDRGVDGPLPTYGDWLAYEPTDKEYISLCYHAQNARMMAELSRAIGKEDRAEHYENLLCEIKSLFRERYVSGGELTESSQTAYLLALGFDMVTDGAIRSAMTEKLKNKIIENDYTLSTGFVGTGVLCTTLAQLGLDGLAYSLLLQTKDPSWLYSVRQGATTVWERWNSYTKEKGFGDVGMNSFNHYAYGAVIEWMFAYMAGIQPGECGFEHFVLCPRPDMRAESEMPAGQKRISRVQAEYACRHGIIRSAWEMEGGETVYRFEVPCGTSAEVEIYAPEGRDFLLINGEKRKKADIGAKTENGKWKFMLFSGNYIIK